MATWFTGVEVCHSLVVTWRPGHWCWVLSQPRCHMAEWRPGHRCWSLSQPRCHLAEWRPGSLVLRFVTASLSHGDLVTGVELCHSLVVTWRPGHWCWALSQPRCHMAECRPGHWCWGLSQPRCHMAEWRPGHWCWGLSQPRCHMADWRPGHWCWGLSHPRCHMATWSLVLRFVTASLSPSKHVTFKLCLLGACGIYETQWRHRKPFWMVLGENNAI